jgi:hypothetical protein
VGGDDGLTSSAHHGEPSSAPYPWTSCAVSDRVIIEATLNWIEAIRAQLKEAAR